MDASTKATFQPSNVLLTFADGTDYTLVPTDLTFPDGSQKGARQCVIVNITDDEVVEYQESFYIGLSTNDTSIEIFRIREQQELELVCIHDNDSEIILLV